MPQRAERTCISDHDIVVVTVSNAEDISSHTVARTGKCKVCHRIFVGLLCKGVESEVQIYSQ